LDEVPRLTDEQRRVFLDRNYGVVATIRRDGSPQLTTVWIDADGEDVLFNIAETRKKLRNLERDPRATLHVQDGDDPYRWLSVTGTVELSWEGAEEHINKLSRKYRGRDFTLSPGERRVIARLAPTRIVAYGLDS
jgi:PPOX class probable F420-dependent enzyme